MPDVEDCDLSDEEVADLRELRKQRRERQQQFSIVDPPSREKTNPPFMSTIVLYENAIHLPDGISSLAAFRDWLRSDDFPKAGRICYLNGQVWVDMSKEQIFTHNQVKQEFNVVIGGLVKAEQMGRYFPDGLYLTNDRANLAG